jgi:hypothetical protein
MPRTLFRAANIEDITVVSESEFNEFFEAVVLTGTTNATELTQSFADYFPGQGLIQGAGNITVITGSNIITLSGAATLQDTYENGNGIITIEAGKPVVVSGIEGDGNVDFKVVGSGTFTEGLQIGTGSISIDGDTITGEHANFTEITASEIEAEVITVTGSVDQADILISKAYDHDSANITLETAVGSNNWTVFLGTPPFYNGYLMFKSSSETGHYTFAIRSDGKPEFTSNVLIDNGSAFGSRSHEALAHYKPFDGTSKGYINFTTNNHAQTYSQLIIRGWTKPDAESGWEYNDIITVQKNQSGGDTVTIDGDLVLSAGAKFTPPEFQETSNDGESSTTSSTWQQKLRLTTGSVPAGKYRIGWYLEGSGDDANIRFEYRVQIDDTTTIMEWHPGFPKKYSSGEWQVNGGHYYATLSAASHDIDLDYRNNDGNTTYIRRARLEIWRVS